MLTFKNPIIYYIFIITSILSAQPQLARADAAVADKINISADLYAVQTNLMPYKGYQNDVSTTVYAQYSDYKLRPLIRYLITNYYYLTELVPPNNTAYTSDRRTAVGVGLDYKFNDYLKFRYIVESVDNKLSSSSYTQESYGVIYNQYLEFEYLELNNYLESFLIPRVSSNNLDTYFRIQALKTFDINRTANFSNVLYPFVQTKVKVNDNVNFGVSGQNGSVGAGYRFYGVNATKDSFAFVLEGHSIFHQSKNFNGDWAQLLAALQLWIE